MKVKKHAVTAFCSSAMIVIVSFKSLISKLWTWSYSLSYLPTTLLLKFKKKKRKKKKDKPTKANCHKK